MIEKIKNPYIPKDFDGSLGCCCEEDKNSDLVNWFTRYTEIKLEDKYLIREDITGAFTPQGGCVHDGYIFRAMVEADEKPAIIQKIRISDGAIVAENRAEALGHANDIFIKDNVVHVLHSSSTNIVYRLAIDTLELLGIEQYGATRWGQAYNATDGVDVIGTVGSAYFSVYIDGEFMYRIKPDNAFSGLVRQGIFCDENYIGVVLDNAYGAVLENKKGSRVMFYTWNGMFIKSVYVPISEIEWSDYKDGKLYVGTYDGRDPNNVKSGKIYVIPFDLYPEQTVITGRPTDVSGGLNNMQRLPEGTPVKLWEGTQMDGVITLQTVKTRLKMDADGPFRYLIFKFDGANAQTFIWFPTNGGTVALRETDVTAAANDSTIRHRETRLLFNGANQTFTVESCIIEEIKLDASENTITITDVDCNKIRAIWGII